MVLDKKRENVDPLLNKIAKRFIKVNPNVLTWISLVFAIFAGVLFYFSSPKEELTNFYLYGAVIFVFFRFNNFFGFNLYYF